MKTFQEFRSPYLEEQMLFDELDSLDEEELNELSPSLLNRYMKKANPELDSKNKNISHTELGLRRKYAKTDSPKDLKRWIKRVDGLHTAYLKTKSKIKVPAKG